MTKAPRAWPERRWNLPVALAVAVIGILLYRPALSWLEAHAGHSDHALADTDTQPLELTPKRPERTSAPLATAGLAFEWTSFIDLGFHAQPNRSLEHPRAKPLLAVAPKTSPPT